ncbi:MAG: hypothetical protein WKG00_11050 [Polyangiaceae bacterium]
MRFANLALSLSILALGACSTASNDDGSGTTGPSSASAGGSGAEGGGGGGGEGATGGAVSSTGQGGEGNAGPCGQDCSAIQAPDCYEAVCNTGEYPGPVGVCTVVPSSGTACDDGLFCTVSDTCSDGVCSGGPQNTCGLELEQCTTITCDETLQACSNAPAADGVACLDDDPCMVNAKCQNGLCVGAPKDCTFSPLSACNAVACNPVSGQCEGTPDPAKDGNSCASGDLCTTGETCSNGACVGGAPKNCSNLSVGCQNGVCDPANGFCVAQPLMQGDACLDGNDECNVGVCDGGGTCQPVPTPGAACGSATDACNNGICSAAGFCQPVAANNGAACSDGNSCTTGETCSAGACTGGQVGQYVSYFSDSFASNAAGWVFDTDWQIGPAAASSGGTLGPDPAMDHTPTADNGVAGVLIGGITLQVVHPFYYITSPVIDVSAAPGQVYLEFWRWLNSDYTPYMQNTVDVWNGVAWVNIWSSGPSPAIQDTAWTKFTYDLTAHKNAGMKVRFGYTVLQSGVYAVSSWNIDDFVVANQSCN